jgi:putative FmdB family regulatory protein
MPTYEYQCKNCGHSLEELQSFNEPPLTHCPKCNLETLARVIGSGGALIFKGTGFYLTDYKKTGAAPDPKPAKKKDEKKTDSTSSTAPSDTKPSSDTKPPASKKE